MQTRIAAADKLISCNKGILIPRSMLKLNPQPECPQLKSKVARIVIKRLKRKLPELSTQGSSERSSSRVRPNLLLDRPPRHPKPTCRNLKSFQQAVTAVSCLETSRSFQLLEQLTPTRMRTSSQDSQRSDRSVPMKPTYELVYLTK